jgi:predicted O-linked N-acetylglucosamine transferase (SPINDLY family)
VFAKAQELHRQGQLEQAQAVYEALLVVDPAHSDALHMLGVIAVQRGNPQRAVLLLGRSLALHPHNPAVHYNLGVALKDVGQTEQALESYDCALALQPGHMQAHFNRGLALQDLERNSEALLAYDQVLALRPDHVLALTNRGNVLRALNQHADALRSYSSAIALQPEYAVAHYNQGVALQDMGNHLGALACFDRAVGHGARFAELHNNRGNALLGLRRFVEAVSSYDAALLARSDYVDAHCNRGIALQELRQTRAALESFESALALEPDRAFLLGMRLHLRMQLARWADFDTDLAQVVSHVLQGEKTLPPLPALALSDSLLVQHHVAAAWVDAKCAGISANPGVSAHVAGDRIRIGYYSTDFHDHASMYLLAQVLELHDKTRFEVFAFSFGPVVHDAMRARVLAAVDHLYEVDDWSDYCVADMSRQLRIDIAVDLKGYTHGSRPGIFAHRAAPAQVNYLGYPGTMAASFMDYIIADPVLIPEHQQAHYTEEVVYLPHSYQPNDRLRPISQRIFTRTDCGLPEHGFVFCCFNATYKIMPLTFDGWIRILGQVEGSVLWLFHCEKDAASSMRARAVSKGIAGHRLVFAPSLPLAEHLARYRCADLFLDTAPCNAHTTASDALWAGLPVLTCMGEAFASRVAASLLKAVDLPELITTTQSEYESLAVALAHDGPRLHGLRQRLIHNRLHVPLFDSQRYTRYLEAAFVAIAQRSRAGLAPLPIWVFEANLL